MAERSFICLRETGSQSCQNLHSRRNPPVNWISIQCITPMYFPTQGRHSLYDWAWEALNREDVDGNSLLKDRFTVVDYRKMLMSDSDTNVESAINAYRIEVVSEVDFPISF